MLLSFTKDLTDHAISEKFELNTSQHTYDWEYYFKNYDNALCYIIKVGYGLNYQIDCRANAFLFLIHHSIELFLKGKLLTRDKFQPTHVLETIYNSSTCNCHELEKLLDEFKSISKATDGSCFRYILDKNGVSYYGFEKINSYKIVHSYIEIISNKTIAEPDTLIAKKKLEWEFTLHMVECSTLGQLRTQYDFALTLLLNGIADSLVSINDIYLPILFLVRHSLELALKDNITGITHSEGNKLNVSMR